MTDTTPFEPFAVQIDLATGVMREPDVHHVRRASEMRGYYAEEAALERLIEAEDDPLHYETFEKRVPHEQGHLAFCISRIQPGRVGEECFMTKGHYHAVAGTAEVYLCLQGEGLMLMMTREGQVACERMVEGSAIYVPPLWAHRSVNTGGVPLTMFPVWPADAGHNYEDIRQRGFSRRAFMREGEIVVE
jgi:glucose-6-phosphate isomerase